MQRIILHIDFDSFFASAEQQFNPLLRGRPIGVTATNGRTCIIAASREAKALGIKSPSRTFEALQKCPSIIFVPAHFTKYWEVSKIFVNVCKDFSPLVEIFSLDEVFMDVTRTTELFGGTLPLIEKIKSRLRVEIGEYITASFGISHNKLLAKLASGLEKPNGVVLIKPEDVCEIYSTTKLTDICGIGSRIEARLNQMGIFTLIQLSTAPPQALTSEFGNAEGNFLYQVGQGLDTREVIPHTQDPGVKSVGRNYCLPANEYNKRKVLQNVFELCEEVGIKLRRLNKKARAVGIFLRGDENIYKRKTYSYFMDSGKDLFEGITSITGTTGTTGSFARDTLDTRGTLDTLSYVRQIGIWASYLQDSDKVPNSIFDSEKKRVLRTTIDQINERFGDHTIRNGFLLNSPKLTTVPNGFMADRFERDKFAKEQKLIEALI